MKDPLSTEKKLSRPCQACGMSVLKADEYHPYAACLMFMGCYDGDTVRANLRAVVLHGRDLEIASRQRKRA